jgi:hypothetical protein
LERCRSRRPRMLDRPKQVRCDATFFSSLSLLLTACVVPGPAKAGPKVVGAGGAKKGTSGGAVPAKDSLSEREAALLQKEKELEAREAAMALATREAEVTRATPGASVL